jgi:hypothetical protein
MDNEQKLVEEMVDVFPRSLARYKCHAVAEEVLSVVKRNIGVVAKTCFKCRGESETCKTCMGTGVVARAGVKS